MTEPTGLPGPTDAELVARVLAADREALGTMYDRYGGKLYDFAYSMLRQREDAADAVADSFVIVAERLGQLREADRLRPWLYAIVRSECLRRLKARKRIAFGDDEQLVAMADDRLTPDQEAERAAAQQIVWDAAAGLADRDRALLDLHLRQGLEGAELGEAMGVTAANAYVMVNRLKAQVERSLGALLIARMGRDDCDELDGVLADWDGTFSPLIRKRVARHVDDCDVCSRRRKKFLSPWMLLATVPVFTAPLSLRDRVVADTELVAFTTPAGEPLAAAPLAAATIPSATRRRPRAAVAAIAAAVVLIGGGGAALLWPGGDDPTPQSADVATQAPAPTEPAATPSAPPKDVKDKKPKPTPSATTPAAIAPGTLTLSTSSISLGRSDSAGSFTVTNTGDAPVAFQLSDGAGWLTTAAASATVAPGGSTTVSVRADRGAVAEGESSDSVRVAWPSGRASVRVYLTEERPPSVGRPSTGADPSCEVPVSVAVSDESRLTSVVLRWSGPSGSDSATMTRSGPRWTAQMGTFSVGGSVTMRVTARDARGNQATGPSRTVSVNPCPQ